MNILYVLGGFVSLAFGVWLTVKQVKIFKNGKQDRFGYDIKGLGVGIMTIMLGIYLLLNYIPIL